MLAMQPDILEHRLRAGDPAHYSVLFRDPRQVREFLVWCQESRAATGICRQRKEEIHAFVMDPDEQVYCLTLRTDSLDGMLRDLVTQYEVEKLREFLSR